MRSVRNIKGRLMMNEVYTCTCGGQKFSIGDGGEITCPNCGRMYQLQWLNEKGKVEFESPENFNKRIREA